MRVAVVKSYLFYFIQNYERKLIFMTYLLVIVTIAILVTYCDIDNIVWFTVIKSGKDVVYVLKQSELKALHKLNCAYFGRY